MSSYPYLLGLGTIVPGELGPADSRRRGRFTMCESAKGQRSENIVGMSMGERKMRAAWYERQGTARDVLKVGEMEPPASALVKCGYGFTSLG